MLQEVAKRTTSYKTAIEEEEEEGDEEEEDDNGVEAIEEDLALQQVRARVPSVQKIQIQLLNMYVVNTLVSWENMSYSLLVC